MNPSTVLDSALRYRARGWSCIDIPYRSKKPGRDGWQNERLDEAELRRRVGSQRRNLSVLTGAPSGGLLDIDLDAPEALQLADRFLPQTNSVFGRAGKPRSHREYVTSPVLPTAKFLDPLRPEDSAMLVEFRADGCHTVFPPSIHEGGEEIVWEIDQEPRQIDGYELLVCVQKLAAAALLVRYWPGEGARHDCAMALAGALLRHRWLVDDTVDFIGAVAFAAGDEEARDRVAAAITTDARLKAGQSATGLPTLKTIMDERVVARITDWLHLKTTSQEGMPEEAESGTSGDDKTILISGRHMHDITTDALDALTQSNDPERFFCRAGVLVRLREGGDRTWSEVLSPDATRGELDRAAWFVQFDRNGLPKPARPPMDVVRDILTLPRLPFPELRGISHSPVLTEHGILASDGYDRSSGLYLSLGGLDGLLHDMSLDEAKSIILGELLGDFPFVDASPSPCSCSHSCDRPLLVRPLSASLALQTGGRERDCLPSASRWWRLADQRRSWPTPEMRRKRGSESRRC